MGIRRLKLKKQIEERNKRGGKMISKHLEFVNDINEFLHKKSSIFDDQDIMYTTTRHSFTIESNDGDILMDSEENNDYICLLNNVKELYKMYKELYECLIEFFMNQDISADKIAERYGIEVISHTPHK